MNDHVPATAWISPWEHDPPTRDADEYIRAHPGSDTDDDDGEDNCGDDNHGGDDDDYGWR